MSVIGSNILAGASGAGGGYQISRSVRLRSSASAYFNRTPASAGNRKTWTWSGWVKRGTVSPRVALFGFGTSSAGGSASGACYFDSNTIYVVSGGGTSTFVSTTPVYRDPSAWYHVVIAFDSTQATASNRVKIYINGSQVTALANTTYPSQNYDSDYNNTTPQYLGARGEGGLDSYFDGYITEINSIDGQALTPASFGETNPVTGVWQPKKYAGTYGTNGFYLNFSDNSAATAAAIGKDSSGNGNNWTPNNISVTAGVTYDSMLDVPTQWADGGNGRGNYAVMNPLSLGSTVTLSNGNLTMAEVGTYATTVSSITMTSGKWYAEMTAQSNTYAGTVGIAKSGYSPTSRLGFQANTWSYNNDGGLYYNSSTLATVSTYTTNDVVGIAFDADNLTITFYKNGVQQGTQYTAANSGLTAGEFYFATGHINSTSAWNFGQRPFAYTPPSGFKALNTLNLPAPTILKGNQYFDATTYSGQNTALSVTNSGSMQPDLVWIKKRNGATDHNLTDAVRGTNRNLISNSTAAEDTVARLTSFNSNGFTLAGAFDNTNISGSTYVGWQWKEGATQGFDIVTYTGDGTSARAISHSLGVAPKMIIIKQRNAGTYGWVTYHASVGAGSYLTLNGTGAAVADTAMFNNTAPTSSVFTLSSGGNIVVTNPNTGTMVAYLFAEVAGFSKFGSYTGNGSADGPFVFCGFRPRFILIKESTPNARGWRIFDTARSPFNQAGLTLSPNTADAEDTGSGLYNQMDILSNGFKLRAGTNSEPTNESGATYIYAAFSENPAKYSLAR